MSDDAETSAARRTAAPRGAAEARARPRLERLQAATAAFARALTLQEVAEVADTLGLAGMEASGCSVTLLAPGGDRLELMHTLGYAPESERELAAVRLDDTFPSARAVRTGAPATASTAEEFRARYPDAAAIVERDRLQAVIAVPMRVQEQVIGCLSYGFREARSFDQDDVAFVQALAEQAGQAVHRVRLLAAERAARLEAEAARAEAERANRARADFLAVMSHELRTPLNAIGGYAQLLELGIHGPVTDAQLEALARIGHNQRHLLTLINDVLSFARIEAGKVEFRLGDVAVPELLADVAALMAPALASRGITCELAPLPAPLLAHADPDKVRQILLNLLDNAVKFTEPGGRILVSAESGNGAAGGAPDVRIAVADTGHGIPPEWLDSIFDAFTRVDSRYTRTTGGVGLGLAISRDLARGMGGDLRVSSTLGEGSTFVLTLPQP